MEFYHNNCFYRRMVTSLALTLLLMVSTNAVFAQHQQIKKLQGFTPLKELKMNPATTPIVKQRAASAEKREFVEKRFKAPRKAISSIDKIVGPAIMENFSSSSRGRSLGGNSATINKVNSTTISISQFIPVATNRITATIDETEGTVSIPAMQVLGSTVVDDTEDTYDIILFKYNASNNSIENSPITGKAYDNYLDILDGWVAVFQYSNGTYYAYYGPWDYGSYIKVANATMTDIWQPNPGIVQQASYNVYVEQNVTNDTVLVTNFGNSGAFVNIVVKNDGTVFLPPQQKIYDLIPITDDSGTIIQDDYYCYPWQTWGDGPSNGYVTGTISTTSISIGNWAAYDSYSEDCEYNSSSVISYNSSSNSFGQPSASNGEYSQDGVKYLLQSATHTASIIHVDAVYNDVVVPQTVTYNGANYTVTAIANQALASNDDGFNLSVSLPSTITTVENGAFDNAETSAIIWNSNTPLPSNAFRNISDSWKNMLLYVNRSGIAPSGFANTIVNGVAQNIELLEGYVFHCPKDFTARNISFSHVFSMETIIGTTQGWETISLPFDVQTISHASKGKLLPFAAYSSSDDAKPFWLYEWSSTGFIRTGSLKANKPYLIALPNNAIYPSEYNLAGSVTFSSTNVVVKATTNDNLTSQQYNGKSFYANYYFKITNQKYANINSVNDLHTDAYGYNPGSIFIRDKRYTFPFEGYIYVREASSAPMVMRIDFASDETDEIELLKDKLPEKKGMNGEIYDLSGRQISNRDSQPSSPKLSRGIYIIDGKKILIK